MKKLLMWVVIGLVGLIVLVAIFGGEEKSKAASRSADSTESTSEGKAKPKEESEPPMQVTADELLNAYKENEVAANQKYKGKRLMVKARIDSIAAGIGDAPFLVLKAGGQYEFLLPQAHLASGEEAAAASLKKGQQITLLCVGRSEVAGAPMLGDCRIQSS